MWAGACAAIGGPGRARVGCVCLGVKAGELQGRWHGDLPQYVPGVTAKVVPHSSGIMIATWL